MTKTSALTCTGFFFPLVREEGTSVWHRPALSGKPYCGTCIRNAERGRVECKPEPPLDEEICQRCEELFHRDLGRTLAAIYQRILVNAERREAEEQTG